MSLAPGELLARAAQAEFYKPRLAGIGADGWTRLAPTRRAELVRDQLAHLPFGTRRVAEARSPVRVGISGSGDDLLVLAWSEKDLAVERAAGARLLARAGIAPGTAIANTLPGALVSPGSLLFGDVVEEYGALDVPLGAIESDAAAKQAWELVDRVEPAVICVESSTAARFLAAAPAAKRPWLRGLLWLRRGASSIDAVVGEAVGFSGWHRQWLAVPEAASFAASSCARGAFHADEGTLIEVADGASAGQGVEGVLLLTPRDGDTALLRYESGIRARRIEACACGAVAAFELI